MIVMQTALTLGAIFMVAAVTLTALDDDWATTFKRFGWTDKVIVASAMAAAFSVTVALIAFIWGI
jgi:hypothetical protein